jgi:DNA-binding winged helix-turn-helix (wHTH) protein/dienelactone hydrolase
MVILSERNAERNARGVNESKDLMPKPSIRLGMHVPRRQCYPAPYQNAHVEVAMTVRFGDFALDRHTREIYRRGVRLRVPGQSVHVLIALLERPGELITREELQRTLWTPDTFVDFDQGLNTAVRRLREALGDTADAPRYVETLPRRGYRFIGTLEEDKPPHPPPVVAETAGVGQPAQRAPGRHTMWPWLCAAAVLALVATAATVWYQRHERARWARERAPLDIAALIDQQDYQGAQAMAEDALALSPASPTLSQLLADSSRPTTITSEPSGAEVFVKGYRGTREWRALGRTPLQNVRIPGGLLRIRLTHADVVPLEAATHWGRPLHFVLPRAGDVPEGMTWVPAGPVTAGRSQRVDVGGFWLGRTEVTNADYANFIRAGGYTRREFWRELLPGGNHEGAVAWHEAMARFVDATGRPGPAAWELGTYPEGRDEFPVTGISWYEAAAYAAFVGGALPTVHHWQRAAGLDMLFADMLALSNFGRTGPARAGEHRGLGPFGTVDMAGNVREWCWNTSDGRRFTLGGGWADERYVFAMPQTADPMARDAMVGFRLMRDPTPQPHLREAIVGPPDRARRAAAPRDYTVDEAQFSYDALPLDTRLQSRDTGHAVWVRESLTITAPDGLTRLPLELFLPVERRQPVAVVLYMPGADAEMLRSRRDMNLAWVEAIVRSGYAVVHPIYAGTFERGVPPPVAGPQTVRDARIAAIREARRALDFVATHPDLDASRISLMGVSNGAVSALITAAVEPRVRTAVLLGAGLPPHSHFLPGLDPALFAPRVTIPVLIVNGRWDFVLPYTTAQVPLLERLGTPPSDRRLVLLDGGHVQVRHPPAVRELRTWLDRHLPLPSAPAAPGTTLTNTSSSF